MIFFSCDEDNIQQLNTESPSATSQSQKTSNNSIATIVSDAFEINDVKVENENLLVEVSYSGGCEEHEFELIWPEVITMIFPPDFGVTLTHNDNEDSCDAYLTETLVFDISNNPLGLSRDVFSVMRISVTNGSDDTNVVSNR